MWCGEVEGNKGGREWDCEGISWSICMGLVWFIVEMGNSIGMSMVGRA